VISLVETAQAPPELAESLRRLLGREVLVVASSNDSASCMTLQARVIGTEDLPDRPHAVVLHFSGAQSLSIACDAAAGFVGCSERRGLQARWIELRLPGGPTIMLEETV
jgi:hypothetical protein